MEKAFGTLARQLRLQKGYSLRELARRIDLSPNFLSKMELGHFPPPSEKKIVLIAEHLEQNKGGEDKTCKILAQGLDLSGSRGEPECFRDRRRHMIKAQFVTAETVN